MTLIWRVFQLIPCLKTLNVLCWKYIFNHLHVLSNVYKARVEIIKIWEMYFLFKNSILYKSFRNTVSINSLKKKYFNSIQRSYSRILLNSDRRVCLRESNRWLIFTLGLKFYTKIFSVWIFAFLIPLCSNCVLKVTIWNYNYRI